MHFKATSWAFECSAEYDTNNASNEGRRTVGDVEPPRIGSPQKKLTMNVFFLGRRRIVGTVTLLLACAAMAGWVRSLFVSGFIDLPLWTAGDVRIGISLGNLWFHHFPLSSMPISGAPQVEWERSSYGFSLTEWYMHDDRRILSGIIPFWPIVLPLTLLSAFFLLGNLRDRTLKRQPAHESSSG